MYTYENYLEEKDSITMEKAAEIHAKICSCIDPENEDDVEILGDFLKAAAKYAGVRAYFPNRRLRCPEISSILRGFLYKDS